MLNHRNFASQTPNVIDPGESPPSRPSRRSATIRYEQQASENQSATPYLWTSAERFLMGQDEQDDECPAHDQLPSAEDARLYAGRILSETSRSLSRHDEILESQPLGLTSDSIMKSTETTSRRRSMLWLCSIIIVVAIVAVVATIGKQSNQPVTPGGRMRPAGLRTVSDRLNSTNSFLNLNAISDGDALSTTESPQAMAARWMADSDVLQYDIPESVDDATYDRFIQRYVLAVLYYSTNGHQWIHDLNFLGEMDDCAWYDRGIVDQEATVYAFGVSCNANLRVDSLVIPKNRLQGSLPNELGFLTDMTFLELTHNELTGTIPDSLDAWSNMAYLNLRNNKLTGAIPLSIGYHMPNLELLALSNNDMAGTLPPSMEALTKIKTLALDDNRFQGDITVVNAMTNLEFLFMDNNKFHTEIDSQFLANLQHLVQLDLSGNNLLGSEFPIHLLTYPKLRVIDLHSNDLTGTLPADIPENPILQFLSLYGNIIAGEIPSSIQHLRELTHLDLSGNAFVGTIPDALGEMPQLTYLFLGDNAFTDGPIPDSFVNLLSLRELSLASTHRTGTIPDWIGVLDPLVLLDISYNDLNGTIPESLWDLSHLMYLLVNRNELSGTISPGIARAKSLSMFLMDKNEISGDLSSSCQELALSVFVADCAPASAAITCPCCTLCCGENDNGCNDDLFYGNLNPVWEANFTRTSYSFSPELIFDSSGKLDTKGSSNVETDSNDNDGDGNDDASGDDNTNGDGNDDASGDDDANDDSDDDFAIKQADDDLAFNQTDDNDPFNQTDDDVNQTDDDPSTGTR